MQNTLTMDVLPYIAEEATLWKRFKRYLVANQETFTLALASMCGNYNVYSNTMLGRCGKPCMKKLKITETHEKEKDHRQI